jgi:Tol biopolymer transport system component
MEAAMSKILAGTLLLILTTLNLTTGCTTTLRTTASTVTSPEAPSPVTNGADQSSIIPPITPTHTPTLPALLPTITPTGTPIPNETLPIYQLTFISDRAGKEGIYGMDVMCLNEKEVCLGEIKLLFELSDPLKDYAWSPDGKMVVYSTGYGGVLYLADWNGKNAVKITDDCGTSNWPKWSPDGSLIAFIYRPGLSNCEYSGPSEIHIYNKNTGSINRIFTAVYEPSKVFWLSGEEMAYISESSETDHTEMIHFVAIEGEEICRIPKNASDFNYILDVTFSAGSNQIAYVGWRTPIDGATSIDIYITDYCENTESKNITNGHGDNYRPTWSPDGNWIAFHSNQAGPDFDIYLINLDSIGLVNITENPASDTLPLWRFVGSH